jgi:hypothetical protein
MDDMGNRRPARLDAARSLAGALVWAVVVSYCVAGIIFYQGPDDDGEPLLMYPEWQIICVVVGGFGSYWVVRLVRRALCSWESNDNRRGVNERISPEATFPMRSQ